MHGLFNRALQCFLRDTYGADLWHRVARDAHLALPDFEAMLQYDIAVTEDVLRSASRHLGRTRESVLEDLGNHLIASPSLDAVRRLLRFGGVGFRDFLHSLEDFPGRCQLALPGVDVPHLTLREDEDGYVLICSWELDGVGHLAMGLLRAMADDYGALAFLEHLGPTPEGEAVSIRLVEAQLFAARPFELSVRA